MNELSLVIGPLVEWISLYHYIPEYQTMSCRCQ